MKRRSFAWWGFSSYCDFKGKKAFSLIAPDVDKIGIMLAYTPLHLLLFEYFKGNLVATSANLSGESIIKDEFNLRQKLDKVFDFYLDYDREIINASDDSIAQVVNGKTMFCVLQGFKSFLFGKKF